METLISCIKRIPIGFLFFFIFSAFNPGARIYAQDIDPGYYYRLNTLWLGDGKSLDVINDGVNNNKPVMANTGAFTGQFWKFTPLGDGYYRIRCQWQGDDKSLDIINDGKNNNAPILAATGPYSGQFWKVAPIGNGYFRLTTQWQGPGKSLDIINDGKNNNTPILAQTGAFTGQYWKLTKLQAVPEPPPPSAEELNKTATFLRNFQGEVSKMNGLANTPLGPYNLKASYTWCSEHAWWGLGLCTENTTETFTGTVDFSWTKNTLKSILSEANNNAASFSNSYAPVQNWINGLPAFSKKFAEKTDMIKSVQQQIKSGNGPNDQQRQAVTQAIQELYNDLDASSKQLQAGIKSLTSFLDLQSRIRERIRSAIDNIAQIQQDALAKTKDDARKTCTQGGTFINLESQFDQIKRDFNNSTSLISNSFQNLENAGREAEKGTAKLLGYVVNNGTELNSILEKLRVAKSDEIGSFIQSIRLDTALRQWQKIASN